MRNQSLVVTRGNDTILEHLSCAKQRLFQYHARYKQVHSYLKLGSMVIDTSVILAPLAPLAGLAPAQKANGQGM